MRRSFLDNENIFNYVVVGLITLPFLASVILACATPSDEEMDRRYAESAKERIVTVSPRPGVECYILRGDGGSSPRVMSCVGTIPTTMGQ
jgi:hypothetical protein